jgi:hypothetical protein
LKKQPLKNSKNSKVVKSKSNKVKKKPFKSKNNRVSNDNPKYGISKLEQDFAHDFLDKLGLKYIYEYEAKDIKRFYDFAITADDEVPFITENKHGINSIKQEGQNVPISFIIEVDGGYWHSDPRLVNEKKLTPTQKHNKFVDFVKDKWCDLHGIPLLRIWEEDIRKNPKLVFEKIDMYLTDAQRKKRIRDNKRKPH